MFSLEIDHLQKNRIAAVFLCLSNRLDEQRQQQDKAQA